MGLLPLAPEASASANSATPAKYSHDLKLSAQITVAGGFANFCVTGFRVWKQSRPHGQAMTFQKQGACPHNSPVENYAPQNASSE
jgi:hypothetical protein